MKLFIYTFSVSDLVSGKQYMIDKISSKNLGRKFGLNFINPLIIYLLVFGLLSSATAISGELKKFVVGFSQDTMENDWRAAQVNEIAKAFKQYPNVKFIYTDGKGRTAKQISDLEDLALKKVDLIITSPRDSIAMTPVISKIYQSGIPVILLTRKTTNNEFTTYISPDDYAIATKAAKLIAKEMNNKGNILILKGIPTTTTAIARTEGFLKEIKKYPEIRISAIKTGNFLRADAIRATEDAIINKIKFDAIYAENDSMAAGARLALKKAGIDPSEKIIVGIDYIREAQIAIKNQTQIGTFTYPTCAEEAVKAAMDILNNKPTPKHITVESQMVTMGNIHKLEPIF